MAQRIAGRPIETNGDDPISACWRRFALWVVLSSVQRFQELAQTGIRKRDAEWKAEMADIRSFLISSTCGRYCGYRFTKKELQRLAHTPIVSLRMFDGLEEDDGLPDSS